MKKTIEQLEIELQENEAKADALFTRHRLTNGNAPFSKRDRALLDEYDVQSEALREQIRKTKVVRASNAVETT